MTTDLDTAHKGEPMAEPRSAPRPSWIYIEEAPDRSPTLVIHFNPDWQTFDLHCGTINHLRLTLADDMAAQLPDLGRHPPL